MVVTWNVLDKSANITLSGGSLVATTTSATQGACRATLSITTAKTYVEFQISNITGSLWSVGFANATASLAAALGSNTNSVVFQPNQVGRTLFNGASLGTDYTGVASQTVCCAFDPVAKLIWFRYGFGYWNGSPTANPATGVGGLSVAAIAAGPYFPIFGDNGSGGAVTARFGALDMWFPIPAGFTAPDVNLQAFMASAKFLGYAASAPPQTAASAASLKGYAASAPPQTGVSVAKILGYLITQDVPFGPNAEKWDVPRPRKKVAYQAGTLSSSIALLTAIPPVVANPFFGSATDVPFRVWRRVPDVGASSLLGLNTAAATPFLGSADPNPPRPARRLVEAYSGFNPALFPAAATPFLGSVQEVPARRAVRWAEIYGRAGPGSPPPLVSDEFMISLIWSGRPQL